jgi:hypothetical protein
MKPNTRCWLAAAVAVAEAVVCWSLLTMGAGTPRTAKREPASAERISNNPPGGNPEESEVAPEQESGRLVLLARMKQWLAARGRDATGLILMWDLTNERSLLDEAREKFPDDVDVCRALVHFGRGPAKPWIERLMAAEPDNPEGQYLKAWTLMSKSWEFRAESDRAGALAALRQAAVMHGRYNDHRGERIQLLRDTALALGVSPGEAADMALESGHGARHLKWPAVMNVLSEELTEAKASGGGSRLTEIARLGLVTMDQFASALPISIVDEEGIIAMRTKLLAELPDDTAIGLDGRRAGDLSAANEARREIVERTALEGEDTAHFMARASDDIRIGYYDRFMSQGGEAAESWVANLIKKPW